MTPSGNTPRIDTGWFPNLCQFGPTPLVMTGIFRLWMIGHFMGPPGYPANTTPPNVESGAPTFQKMLWKPDATTGIDIGPVTMWDPELIEKRPAIIIRRDGFRRYKLGIGDKMMGGFDASGQQYYTNAWQGSHTLFCIANKGAEVELLAAEVYRELNEFCRPVQAKLSLLRLEPLQIGDLMILEESRQNWTVPIVVGYAWTENWKVQQEAPFLKTIDISLMRP